jgi:ribosome-binding protein aMBF1 (putative translation factor)
MKCKRCGKDIEPNAPVGVTICGSCADDLRQEEEAMIASAQAEAEAQMAAGREAYEEEMHMEQMDTAEGYRYI